MNKPSSLSDWTSEEIELGRRWVQIWKLAAADLERIKRRELRELDAYKTIQRLCHTADFTRPPTRRSPGPVSSNNSDGSKRQPAVNEVINAAAELQGICQSQGWQF